MSDIPFLKEIWREIPGFPGCEASDLGFIRTYWYKVRNSHGYGSHRELKDVPRPLQGSPDDNGYLHTNLYCDIDGRRYTRKIHVLVGITFLPLPDDFYEKDYTIDHKKSGALNKLNNAVSNLQWVTRGDNVRKAYRDGLHDARIRASCRDVIAIDTWFDRDLYFKSITEAAKWLKLKHSTICHAIGKDYLVARRYIFEYPEGEDRLLYANEEYETYQRIHWL